VDVTDTGAELGASLAIPGAPTFTPWLEAGLVYRQSSIRIRPLNLNFSSDHSIGFQVGGGLELPIARQVALAPAVRYTDYAADGDVFGERDSATGSHLAIELAASLRF
jgi:opacity protein-like surface antigen